MSARATPPTLSHTTYAAIRFPAVFALLNPRAFVVPLVTWFAFTWIKAGDAALAVVGDTTAIAATPTMSARLSANWTTRETPLPIMCASLASSSAKRPHEYSVVSELLRRSSPSLVRRNGRCNPRRIAGDQVGQVRGHSISIAWEGYAKPQWVKRFEKATGCQVNAKYAGAPWDLTLGDPPVHIEVRTSAFPQEWRKIRSPGRLRSNGRGRGTIAMSSGSSTARHAPLPAALIALVCVMLFATLVPATMASAASRITTTTFTAAGSAEQVYALGLLPGAQA